jgi:alkaline phosphatase D
MLGDAQEAWLGDGLRASNATWNVLANQVILAPAPIPVGATTIFNLDQWDGYPSARDRVLSLVADTENVVIVTGDIHASAVAEIQRGGEVVAVEFVGTSISSSFPVELVDIFEAGARSIGAKMADARHRGYVRCTVTPDSFTAEYRTVESVATATSPVITGSAWVVDAGTPGVRAA